MCVCMNIYTVYVQYEYLKIAPNKKPFHLPATLVISSVVQKFAVITIATKTRFFVVFANVRLVVLQLVSYLVS